MRSIHIWGETQANSNEDPLPTILFASPAPRSIGIFPSMMHSLKQPAATPTPLIPRWKWNPPIALPKTGTGTSGFRTKKMSFKGKACGVEKPQCGTLIPSEDT